MNYTDGYEGLILTKSISPNKKIKINKIKRNGGTFRTSNAEKREQERLANDIYEDVRRAAECHRQVRNIFMNSMDQI